MLNEYLALTNDEYAVVKFAEKAKLILEEDETVTMKMVKEREHPVKTVGEKKGKKSRGTTAFELDDDELFEILRVLRAELMKKEEVPLYILFE